jgi:predicted nucleic acid-binding protein
LILLDTSGLLAALDSGERTHARAAASLASAKPPRILSPFVLAELDYLVAARVGQAARASLLEEVQRGAYQLQAFSGSDVAEAMKVMRRHSDLGVSLADASIVVLAAHHDVCDVLTLDERHFRVLKVDGRPFRVLPADA